MADFFITYTDDYDPEDETVHVDVVSSAVPREGDLVTLMPSADAEHGALYKVHQVLWTVYPEGAPRLVLGGGGALEREPSHHHATVLLREEVP